MVGALPGLSLVRGVPGDLVRSGPGVHRETRTVSACVTGYPQESAYGASVTVRIQPEEGRAFRACLYLSEGWRS